MPTYNFICERCGARFEEFIPFADNLDHLTCPNGHSSVRRIFSPPTIVFKGSGFYVTDNRRASGKKAD